MERKEVIVSSQELARQKEFTRKMRGMNDRRTRTPLALVDTFGCQQNVADGEVLMGMLREMGYELTRDENQADVILLNTCAIREHAEQRVLGNVGALVDTKRRHPEQLICLCGCMVQEKHVAEKIRQSYRHVDLVFGPHALWKFPEMVHTLLTQRGRIFSVADEAGSIAEGIPTVRQDGIKAWVSIMYGCNNFCTYCIVPYVRGRERSRAPEDILEEVRGLVAQGYKDITLLGQNVNSYGKDLPEPMDFSDLLSAVNDIPGEFLIRFMTSHPKDATHKLFETMARCEKVAPVLHLPFQAGNDRILKVMNRRHTIADYLAKIRDLKSLIPDIVLTSDIIVGFPGETDEEFQDTLSLVEAVRYDAMFTFIYSPRVGTPAAKMDDPVSREEKQVWFEKLVDAQNAISAKKHAAYIGRTVKVLVDGESDDEAFPLAARTEGNRLVRMKGDKALIGTFAKAKITDSNTWALYGEAVEE